MIPRNTEFRVLGVFHSRVCGCAIGLFITSNRKVSRVYKAAHNLKSCIYDCCVIGHSSHFVYYMVCRYDVQIGSNMPARACRRLGNSKNDLDFDEVYDVVLYFGIIDILQEYDMGKKLEHAYKSLHFDSLSISAVDPALYSKRFLHFINSTFPAVT